MIKPKELFSHASPIFPVPNVTEAMNWYKEKLGFTIDFTWEEPATYAVISRGEVKVHLSQKDDDYQPSKTQTALYIFVHDVDAAYEEFQSRGVKSSAPQSYEYGMRDFDLADLNGFRLTFGKGT